MRKNKAIENMRPSGKHNLSTKNYFLKKSTKTIGGRPLKIESKAHSLSYRQEVGTMEGGVAAKTGEGAEALDQPERVRSLDFFKKFQ